MASPPMAYFITFTTYGTWLHGRSNGSVDCEHNVFGTPLLPSDEERESRERAGLVEPPYVLGDKQCEVVLLAIQDVAHHRGWTLHAVHVRSNHVHIVVSGDAKPEKIMSDFKAYASRRLRERLGEPASRRRWTVHGSTRYLWEEPHLAGAIEYTVNGQGDAMSVYDGRAPGRAASISDRKADPPHPHPAPEEHA